ncbi:hypothetical protein Mtc_2350 [Methanocella conradii HZ254]|uniref:Uncharacterized protein n=1 Tax=Methanocella conradii (strain DSM 24694 / JCM 17849 / CGMCC 1.5162 / HZ254) TaxID=1041930 RepID=H8I4Y9_METCZ|nr:hypothetical protein [Methanocella conradii]AFD01083.1 hypothetical protein Mtc_2350 [Methanocella conradii HZ254]
MIKVSKAFVLILAAFMLPVISSVAAGAFAFSVPQLTVVAGPGLGGGPTVFNTYSHDLTTLGTGVATDAIANAYAAPSAGSSWGTAPGWIPPLGPACPPIPGCPGGIPFGFGPFVGPSAFAANPVAADQAANAQLSSQALEDNTFATSFYTAGGLSPFAGLCNSCIAGNAPQQFTLQFF